MLFKKLLKLLRLACGQLRAAGLEGFQLLYLLFQHAAELGLLLDLQA